MTKRWRLGIAGAVILAVQIFAQNSAFDTLASEFETRLNAAAGYWRGKQPARALDGFMEARDWISRAPIPYGDVFAWSGSRALMTYSIVLARLVEADTEKEKESPLAPQIESQAKQWAEILSKQSEVWSKIEPGTSGQSELRKRWIKRFQSVINKTRNAPTSE